MTHNMVDRRQLPGHLRQMHRGGVGLAYKAWYNVKVNKIILSSVFITPDMVVPYFGFSLEALPKSWRLPPAQSFCGAIYSHARAESNCLLPVSLFIWFQKNRLES